MLGLWCVALFLARELNKKRKRWKRDTVEITDRQRWRGCDKERAAGICLT